MVGFPAERKPDSMKRYGKITPDRVEIAERCATAPIPAFAGTGLLQRVVAGAIGFSASGRGKWHLRITSPVGMSTRAEARSTDAIIRNDAKLSTLFFIY